MATRPVTHDETERAGVPSLQIMPRLEAVGDGYAALRAGVGRGARAGAIALLLAAAVAAGVFLLTRGAHRRPARSSAAALGGSLAATVRNHGNDSAVARAGQRLAVAEFGLASRLARTAASSAHGSSAGSTSAAPSAHYLSASELVSLADGSTVYQPAATLVDAYTQVADRYHIPWRVLAALEYIQGGYTDVFAGPSASAEAKLDARVGVGGQRAINAAILAHAVDAAGQPSATLEATGRQLAADGAASSPAQGLATYLRSSAITPAAVLTLAQEINASAVSSSSAPLVKVGAMLNEARILNGLPYVWGGGHTNPAWVVGSGYDCSGFVSEVLHSAGYLTSPDTTQTLPGSAGIANGPGKYVTLYDRTIATLKVWVKKKKIVTIKQAVNPASAGVHLDRGRRANSLNSVNSVTMQMPRWVGQWKTIRLTKLVPTQDTTNNDEHVIIDIDGQWWESGGSTADGGAAMVHEISDPSKAYLKSFNRILHPVGL
jgi:hypothetical protein